MKESEILTLLKRIPIINLNNFSISKMGPDNKTTWLINTLSANYVLKVKRVENKSFLLFKLLRNFLNLDSQAEFSRELLVYSELNNLSFEHFKYPKMLFCEKNSYILLEYLGTESSNNIVKASPELLANSMFEFNTSVFKFNSDGKNRITGLAGIRKSSFLIFYWSLKYIMRISPLDSLRCLYTLLKCMHMQKKNRFHFILHRDLIGQNNIIQLDSNNYFYDFESAIIENRWILTDIIDLSFSYNLQFDKNILQAYVNLLEKHIHLYENINVRAQVRITLMHRLISRAFSKFELSEIARQRYMRFIREILIYDKKFNEWYDANVGI